MRTSSAYGFAMLAVVLATAPAAAFDIGDLNAETPPGEAFSYGLQEYNTGDKLTAAEALSFAAGKGVTGAQWKLGNMYAEGDGVARDEVKAFELFSEVVINADEDDIGDEASAPYVSNAFVRLGTYYREGIPNSKIKADPSRARQLYYNAASIFGNADAQLNLARMAYEGQGGERDLVQSVKWANLAAEKGSPAAKELAVVVSLELARAHLDGKGANRSMREAARWARQAADYGSIEGQALLGHVLFEGDGISRQPVDGLMLLTVALERSDGKVRWIADMHEEALSIATEAEWFAARARATEWLTANGNEVAAAAPTN